MVRNYTLEGDSPYYSAARELKKRHPNVEVVLEGLPYDEQRTKVLMTVAAGKGPCVAQVDCIWLGEFAEGGILIDLTPYYEKWEDKNDIPEVFLESSKYNGKYYGVWLNSDVRLLQWEKEPLRKAGFDPEVPPKYWEEMAQMVQKAQNPPELWGFLYIAQANDDTNDYWYPWLWQGGGRILSEDYTKAMFNSEAGVQALQFWVDLMHKYKVTPQDVMSEAEDPSAALAQGLFVMGETVGLNWSRERFPTAEDLKKAVGARHLPIPPGGRQATGSGGWLLGITRDCKYPDLAWEFITLVTSPENAKDFWKREGMVPVRKSAIKDVAEYEEAFPYYHLVEEAVAFTHFRPYIPEYPKFAPALWTAIQKALLLEATPKEALDEAAEETNKILAGEK